MRAAELVGTGLTYAQAGAVVGRSERTVTRWLQDPQLRALAAREAAGAGELGPVLAAARALAALRPQELEPEQSGPGLEQPEPSIIVYDLPPGATPVLHRARAGAQAESSPEGAGADGAPDGAGAPAEQLPSAQHVFMYQTAEGELEQIGWWHSGTAEKTADSVVTIAPRITDDPALAERWRSELAAGRLPPDPEHLP